MKAMVTCVRCGRNRYVDRMHELHCIHGVEYVCASRSTCKRVRKENQRVAARAARALAVAAP